MEKEMYFLNSGIQPQVQFEPTMHSWNTFTTAQELNCSSSDQTSSCFLNPNWEMESAFSSMASSSPVTLNSTVPTDALGFRELIRKLGPLSSSGELPKTFPAAPSYPGSTSFNASCYSTPILNERLPNSRISVPLNPALHALSADPGFTERAAKFSCFGSRSFNGRKSEFGQNNAELPYQLGAPTMGNGKLQRVSSSPSLKQDGSPPSENKNLDQAQMEMRPADGLVPANGANSNEESSVSEQVQSGETGLKTPNELNSRKRKAVARGKAKEDGDANVKRSKLTEADVSENGDVKTEEEAKSGDNKTRDDKSNQKPPEPPKDYIHVRARRGQATDAHSLAERVRREKISERMKFLQDLVPGCNKVTGKALMLDEIINYVQSLQRQVEFLSMKLASVNPRLDNMDNLPSKDGFQPNASLPHLLFPMGSSEPTLHKNQHQQVHQLHNNGSVDDVDTTFCRNLGIHLPPLHGPFDGIPQFPPFCEEDLQSIVQMGYSQNPDTQIFPVANQESHMKIEL